MHSEECKDQPRAGGKAMRWIKRGSHPLNTSWAASGCPRRKFVNDSRGFNPDDVAVVVAVFAKAQSLGTRMVCIFLKSAPLAPTDFIRRHIPHAVCVCVFVLVGHTSSLSSLANSETSMHSKPMNTAMPNSASSCWSGLMRGPCRQRFRGAKAPNTFDGLRGCRHFSTAIQRQWSRGKGARLRRGRRANQLIRNRDESAP